MKDNYLKQIKDNISTSMFESLYYGIPSFKKINIEVEKIIFQNRRKSGKIIFEDLYYLINDKLVKIGIFSQNNALHYMADNFQLYKSIEIEECDKNLLLSYFEEKNFVKDKDNKIHFITNDVSEFCSFVEKHMKISRSY